jgi:hypothetical protein
LLSAKQQQFIMLYASNINTVLISCMNIQVIAGTEKNAAIRRKN